MQRRLKRGFDIAGAVFGLALAAPVMALAALLIRWRMGPPVLFRQSRGGLNGSVFTLYKFRTMTTGGDTRGEPLDDDRRLTRLGRWLRAASLDELPQLWNVLRGEMSLVGPRPLYSRYLARYNDFQRRRLQMRPGLTGLAQVTGRNALSWERKFELDIRYVEHWSLWLDAAILIRTLAGVARREGISQAGHATMPEFLGEQEGRLTPWIKQPH